MARPPSVECIEKLAQLCRCLELRNGVEDFERRRECIRQAPDGARLELGIAGVEVGVVDIAKRMLRRIKFRFHERPVDDELGSVVGELNLAPSFDLPAYRLEVPLHAVHAHGERVHQAEVFRVPWRAPA